jgi:SOS-response transcriptional repressor LexA
VPLLHKRMAEYAILQFAEPGGPEHNIGILLLDHEAGRMLIRTRQDWKDFPPSERSVLAGLSKSIVDNMRDMGGDRFMRWMEDKLSNSVRLTNRTSVPVDSFVRVLDRLYERYVHKLVVMPFETHLPLYTLEAAAGGFGAEQVVEEEDWVRAPEDMRLTEDMFIAHVTGRSMEPRIPDGSLNIFRVPVAGSRQNKIVLVELLAESQESARYTVKKFSSRKVQIGEGQWVQEEVTLSPLNPEFQPLHLRGGGVRVVAEWLRVLD